MESKAMALELELDAPDVQDELYGQELALEAEQAMIFEIMADEAQKLADDPVPADIQQQIALPGIALWMNK